MLTSDLLRIRSSGASVKPSFVDTGDVRLRDFAASLLQIYTNGIGQTREMLDSLTEPYVNMQRDRKLANGFLKLLRDRSEFSAVADVDYPVLRRKLFLHSASLLKNSSLPGLPLSVRDVVFSTAGDFQEFQKGIYADLPENETLLSIKKTYPVELLERYNVALVQSLLIYSSSLKAEVAEEDPAKLRRLFKYLKFFRLLVRAELKKKSDESRISMVLDGPASLFENSQKYGLQLASFFPAICQMSFWKISCELKLRGKVRKLNLDSSSGLKSHYSNYSAYRPEEIKLFSSYFQEQIPEWHLDDTPGFLKFSGQKLIFPDFVFRSLTMKQELPLELFHRWHAGQLEERLEFCEKNPSYHLLLGVDKSLLKKDGVLKERLENSSYFQDHGFLFRDFPGVENVLKLLRKFSSI